MRSAFLPLLLLGLGGCDLAQPRAEGDAAGPEAASQPRGDYAIDSETGEIRARHTDIRGVTTTLRAGEEVPVELPKGFTLYPNATVTNNTRVEQRDGVIVLLDFESSDPAAEVVAFYRRQAQEAGMAVDVELATEAMTMIGSAKSARRSFTLTVRRKGDTTRGQLAIGQGIT